MGPLSSRVGGHGVRERRGPPAVPPARPPGAVSPARLPGSWERAMALVAAAEAPLVSAASADPPAPEDASNEWVARRAVAIRKELHKGGVPYLRDKLAPFTVKGDLRGAFAKPLEAVEALCAAILELGVSEYDRQEQRTVEERDELVEEEKLASQAKEVELEARRAEAERQAVELKRAHAVFMRETERIARERAALEAETQTATERHRASSQQRVQAQVDLLAATTAEAEAELETFRSRAQAELAVKMSEFEQEFEAARKQLEEEIAAYVDRESRDAAALAQAEHAASSAAQELADREQALEIATEEAKEAARLEAAAWDVVRPQEEAYEEQVRHRQARFDAENAACDVEEEKASAALQRSRVALAETLSEDVAKADKALARALEDINLKRMETQMGIDARTRKDEEARAAANGMAAAAVALDEDAAEDDRRAEEALREAASTSDRVRLEADELLASAAKERDVTIRAATGVEAAALSALATERAPVEAELERQLGSARAEAEGIWAIDPVRIDADRTLAEGTAAEAAWQEVSEALSAAQGELDLLTERRAQESRNKTKEWSDMETKYDAKLKTLRKRLEETTEAARPEGDKLEKELAEYAKASKADVAEIREKERRLRSQGEKLVLAREEVARQRQRKLEDDWFSTQANRKLTNERVEKMEDEAKSKKEWNIEALDVAGQAADELETLLRSQEKEMLSDKHVAEKEFAQLRAELRDEEAALDERFQPEEQALLEAIAALRADLENDLAAMREELAAEHLRHKEKILPLEAQLSRALKDVTAAEAAVIEGRTKLDKEVGRLQEETAVRTRETESVSARANELAESATLLSATAQLRLIGVQLAALPLKREQPISQLLQDATICREEHARIELMVKNEKVRHERAVKRFEKMLGRRKALFEEDAAARTEELHDEKEAARAVIKATFDAGENRLRAMADSVQRGIDELSALQDAASPSLDALALEEERVEKDRLGTEREANQARRRTELDAKREREEYDKACEDLAAENRIEEEKLAAELARIEAQIAETLKALEERENERRGEVELLTEKLAHVRRHSAAAAKELSEAEQALSADSAEKDSRYGGIETSLSSRQRELEERIKKLAGEENERSRENNIKSAAMREGEAKREAKYAQVFHLVHSIEADLAEKRGGYDDRLARAQDARKEAESVALSSFAEAEAEVERRRLAANEAQASLSASSKDFKISAKVKRDDAELRRATVAEQLVACTAAEAEHAELAAAELAVHAKSEEIAREECEARHDKARQMQGLGDATATEAHAKRMEEISERRREASRFDREEMEGEEVKRMQVEVLQSDAREVASAAQEAAARVASCRAACESGATLTQEAAVAVERCQRDLKRSSTIANRERERVNVELTAVRRDIDRDAQTVRDEFASTEAELRQELFGPVQEAQRDLDELRERVARESEAYSQRTAEELREGLAELAELEKVAAEEFSKQEEQAVAESAGRIGAIETRRIEQAAMRRKLRSDNAEAALQARFEHKERMSKFSVKLEKAKADLDAALEQKREELRLEVEKARRNEELHARAKVEAESERRRLEIDSMLMAEKARLKLEAEQEMMDAELEMLRMEEETRTRLEVQKADRIASIEAERRAQRDAMEAEYRVQRERMEAEMKRVEAERLARVEARFAPVTGLLEAPAPLAAALEGPLPTLGERPGSQGAVRPPSAGRARTRV